MIEGCQGGGTSAEGYNIIIIGFVRRLLALHVTVQARSCQKKKMHAKKYSTYCAHPCHEEHKESVFAIWLDDHYCTAVVFISTIKLI